LDGRRLSGLTEEVVEFLVEFQVDVPEGTPDSEVERRERAEAAAAANLARERHLARLWKPKVAPGVRKAVGLYRADSEAQLDGFLGALLFSDWMQVTVTPFDPHPQRPDQNAGTLVPGASADWQTVLPDDTAVGDIRYPLRTDASDLLYVQSRGVRHGPAEVLARLSRGEDVARFAPPPRSRPPRRTSTG
jgi:muconolactone delta-isomerase